LILYTCGAAANVSPLAFLQAKKGIEVGKENRAPFSDLAKGYARLGNSLKKLDRSGSNPKP